MRRAMAKWVGDPEGMERFECFCGQVYSTLSQLEKHMATGCMQFATQPEAPRPPSMLASAAAAEEKKNLEEKHSKRARASSFFDSRREKVTLALAQERYFKRAWVFIMVAAWETSWTRSPDTWVDYAHGL